jgi:uncharacterized protein YhaN
MNNKVLTRDTTLNVRLSSSLKQQVLDAANDYASLSDYINEVLEAQFQPRAAPPQNEAVLHDLKTHLAQQTAALQTAQQQLAAYEQLAAPLNALIGTSYTLDNGNTHTIKTAYDVLQAVSYHTNIVLQ